MRPPTRLLQLALKVTTALAALAIGLSILLPIVWMALASVRPERDLTMSPPSLLPRSFTVTHYVDVWSRIPFAHLYWNTIVFAGLVTVCSLVFDSMTAYALARLRFKGAGIVAGVIIAGLTIPFQVTLVPLYDLMNNLGLVNTTAGLVLPRLTNAFGIFFLRQFFLSLPRDIDEAARIDGASEWRIYARVILPLARPALLTLALFHFQFNWNDLLWPLIMTQGADHATLPAGLATFTGQHSVEYGLLMTGSVLAIAPIVLMFLLVQRSFVQGIATTGNK
ncbi:carbohydrate ABC transporter permease [Dactylosporangium sp. CA-233914]|uniref:carbohydrate ABC transporter permease n=1 Tax=Dactylosporangium sp. CA-233914 TaxID=3239934 RepID=UPI003D937170